MKRICLAIVVLSAALSACSGGSGPARANSGSTTRPAPKDFRKTLLSEATQVGHGVALSGDGKRALISSVEEATDPPHGSVTLWDLSDPLKPRSSVLIADRGGTALKVALSGDGEHAATFNPVGQVTFWDLSDPSHPVSRPFADRGITTLAFDHNARHAITGGDDGVFLWDLTDPVRPGKKRLLAAGTYTTEAFQVTMSADGRRALVSRQEGNGDGEVALWDLSDPAGQAEYALLRNVRGYSANTVALSGDGEHALVGFHHWTTYKNVLTYWDLRQWDKSELKPMTGWKVIPETSGSVLRWEVALSQDGTRAVIARQNDPADPTDPKPPRSDVMLWALDTLNAFQRFSLSG